MKRSKNQAVYKYLPGIWISDKDNSGHAVSARINCWNCTKMSDIYDNFIQNEIKRQIRLFGDRGGDISSFDISPEVNSFWIVEPACNDGIPDIVGETSPLVFYCSKCERVFELKNSKDVNPNTWYCQKCGTQNVKQLQMIYTCECGFAQPLSIPRVDGIKDLKYKPAEKYKMYYRKGNSEKTETAEFAIQCPNCRSRLVPDNANSGRNFKPFTLKIINLVDPKSGQFYEKGIEAQKTIVARWFNKISAEDYENILNNIELAFSDKFQNDYKRKEAEEQVRKLIKDGLMPESNFEAVVNSLLKSSSDNMSIDKCVSLCDELFSTKKSEDVNAYNQWLNNFSFKLMQYYTIRFAKSTITIEDSIKRQLEMELIDNAEEIYNLNNKLGIKNMQVSCDIQIINCTYGYTRRLADPKNMINSNCRLKLNAFDKCKDGTANQVYGAKLNTEGILFEISQEKIIDWLYKNEIIPEELLPDLEDEQAVKEWFAENVHSDAISMFGVIEDEKEEITRQVFALLHSMSHAFIKAAGELSGLSGNSLTEMIIVETASIFIYAQTSQGIPLGALSGMAESNYKIFLQKVYDESRNCIFDPICTSGDGTACSACLIIPEISCNHFNAGLGRKYLYSLETKAKPDVGFWEM